MLDGMRCHDSSSDRHLSAVVPRRGPRDTSGSSAPISFKKYCFPYLVSSRATIVVAFVGDVPPPPRGVNGCADASVYFRPAAWWALGLLFSWLDGQTMKLSAAGGSLFDVDV